MKKILFIALFIIISCSKEPSELERCLNANITILEKISLLEDESTYELPMVSNDKLRQLFIEDFNNEPGIPNNYEDTDWDDAPHLDKNTGIPTHIQTLDALNAELDFINYEMEIGEYDVSYYKNTLARHLEYNLEYYSDSELVRELRTNKAKKICYSQGIY